MKKIFIILFLILNFAGYAYGAIEISTDNRSLFFGLMQLGQEKELAQFGNYHNQVTCRSTNGHSWYLKVNLLQPLTAPGETIPLENFKWQMVWTDGKGTIPNPYHYKEFSLAPDLVYISGQDEASGSSIKIQFKYYLKIPEEQINGTYNTTIRFTLTEIL